MTGFNSARRRVSQAGFTLPAILVVVGALLILAVGALIVVGIERSTARSFVDRQRAELAATAGLEEVRGLLGREAANDDFIILSGNVAKKPGSTKEAIPYLYLARGSGGGENLSFRYLPLFSTDSQPATGAILEAPNANALIGSSIQEISALPWYDSANVAWIGIPDAKDKIVARYAYWVEDLQGKLYPKVAGNLAGPNGVHARSKYPDPGSKPLSNTESPLNVVAVHVLDPQSGDRPVGGLTRKVVEGRPAMVSPDSILGATAFTTPQERSITTGLLMDPLAASLERSVSPAIEAYREQPVVPFAPGLSKDVTGKPKLNLNDLLSSSSAVDDFAAWINLALPDFEDERRGGFPENYLKTIAANALGYADEDSEPTIFPGSHRGLDAYAMLSEIVLKIEYRGYRVESGRLLLNWRFKLFGEFWNTTNQPVVNAMVRLSYEVALNHTAIGGGVAGMRFDDPTILLDRIRASHNLTQRNGRFFSPEVRVDLQPDEYKFFQFAQVQCLIDVGPNNVNYNTEFILQEKPYASGVSVLWNGVETERIGQMVRDIGALGSKEMEFTILFPKNAGKAGLPGSSYGPFGGFTNNMGDPRMSHYFRPEPLSENSLKNLSPNRRNVRRSSVYNFDSPEKRVHYGRTLPSEWPDGGHDSLIGSFLQPPLSDLNVEPTSTIYQNAPASSRANAPMRISNVGRFHSAAELGNIYDPIMWSHAYIDLPDDPGSGARDTRLLNMPYAAGKASMPSARNSWPDVTSASAASSAIGGGNTLRIGRPEHPRFDISGLAAGHLLDLFHAGDTSDPLGQGPEAKTVNINGNINVNTAEKDALRAMAAGMLEQDPELRRVTSWAHEVSNGNLSPATTKVELGSPTLANAADRIAEGILHSRPFASMQELAAARDAADEPIFGNKKMYPQTTNIQWTDAAAEEVFARVHDAATLRSRNFRVWVIGQSITGNASRQEVLAESRKVFTVFADPGERKIEGAIDPTKSKLRVIYENDF